MSFYEIGEEQLPGPLSDIDSEMDVQLALASHLEGRLVQYQYKRDNESIGFAEGVLKETYEKIGELSVLKFSQKSADSSTRDSGYLTVLPPPDKSQGLQNILPATGRPNAQELDSSSDRVIDLAEYMSAEASLTRPPDLFGNEDWTG